MSEKVSPEIEALLKEDRSFAPSDDFCARAIVNDPGIYAKAARDPEAFWAGFAKELEWIKPWSTRARVESARREVVCRRQLNLSANCLDRHVRTARRDKAAFIWEGEPGDRRTLTYLRPLSAGLPVCERAEVARRQERRSRRPLPAPDSRTGHRDARLRTHRRRTFSRVRRLQRRIASRSHQRLQCTLLVTADGGYRRGSVVPLKQVADEALAGTPSITNVVVVRRGFAEIPVKWMAGRDHWFHDLMAGASSECAPEAMDSEDMLYILYTSGTTGKAEGHRSYHRRLSHRRLRDHEVGLRSQG